MPTNYIDGIPVEFPHSAYPCQVTFMQSVLRALKNRQNALLESPTGTGKTLSLLCAALAWRTAEMGRIQLKEQIDTGRSANYDTIMERRPNVSGESAFRTINSASGSVNRLQVALDESLNHSKTETSNSNSIDDEDFNSKPPLIIYASRTHSQLAQVIGELRRTTYRPKIAIVASRDQMCIHPNVKELTNSSTQSAACNRLTKKKACEFHARVPEALNHLKKRPGSDNSTSNSNNNQAKDKDSMEYDGNNNKEIMDMEDIIEFASLHKACPYYTSRELLQDADLVFMPYNYLLDKKTRGSSLLSFKDAIVIFDEAHNVESSCYDAVSCEINSDDLNLSEKELQHCLGLLDSPFFGTSLSALGGVSKDTVLVALKFIENLKRNLDKFEIPKNVNFISEPGDSVFRVFEEQNQTDNLNSQKPIEIDCLLGSFEEIVKLYLEDQYNRRSGKRSSFQSVVNALRTIYGQSEATEEESDGEDPAVVYSKGLERDKRRKELIIKSKAFYRMVITEPTTHTGNSSTIKLGNSGNSVRMRTLGYWCFNPGVVMKDLMGMGVRSIVLTSGTLSPMKSFMQEMQIDFQNVLENDHVIDDEQVFATVVGTGPTGKPLNSSFNQRDSQDYQQELGLTIVNFCRVIPDGVLVFFPSYQVMDSCLNYWQICRPGGSSAAGSIPGAQTIFQMIQSHKIPIIEPKNKGELSVAMERYSRIIDDHSEPRGSIFFAVCRGKVSEGLDFSDAKGRAVIVTGIPYPPFKDPKIILKKQYLQDQQLNSTSVNNNSFLTGSEWYNQQASRAVNQALGRVIRHRRDFGAILLCDERFGNPGTIGQLSKWLRGRVKISASFGEVQGGLARFFKDKPKNNCEAVVSSNKPQQTNISDLNIKLNVNTKNEVQMHKFKLDAVAFPVGSSTTKPFNEIIFKSENSVPIIAETKKFDWFNTSKSTIRDKEFETKVDENKNKLSSQNSSANIVSVDKEKQKKAQDYLDLTRKSLPKESFRNFMGLLKNYRAGQISIEKLLTDLVEVVNGASTTLTEKEIQALLEGFETFVPVKHRNLFEEVLKKQKAKLSLSSPTLQENKLEVEDENKIEIADEGQQYLIGKQKLHTDFVGKRPLLDIEPIMLKRKLTDSLPIPKKEEVRVDLLNTTDSHEICPICKDVCSDPFRAKCNHVACFECWNAWLSRTLECPLCRQRTRISQLRRNVFDVKQ